MQLLSGEEEYAALIWIGGGIYSSHLGYKEECTALIWIGGGIYSSHLDIRRNVQLSSG
jgi:hypothetical protein